tara:strand:- start:517 stop:1098 length:582 start_codon:yes stop_codon:yes gene_type:complete
MDIEKIIDQYKSFTSTLEMHQKDLNRKHLDLQSHQDAYFDERLSIFDKLLYRLGYTKYDPEEVQQRLVRLDNKIQKFKSEIHEIETDISCLEQQLGPLQNKYINSLIRVNGNLDYFYEQTGINAKIVPLEGEKDILLIGDMTNNGVKIHSCRNHDTSSLIMKDVIGIVLTTFSTHKDLDNERVRYLGTPVSRS